MNKELKLEIVYKGVRVRLETNDILTAIIHSENFESNLYIDGKCVFSPSPNNIDYNKKNLEEYGITFVLENHRWIPKRMLMGKKVLTIKYVGDDDWGRKMYKGIQLEIDGEVKDRKKFAYVEVDGKLHTCNKLYGEPDCPINDEFEIVKL